MSTSGLSVLALANLIEVAESVRGVLSFDPLSHAPLFTRPLPVSPPALILGPPIFWQETGSHILSTRLIRRWPTAIVQPMIFVTSPFTKGPLLDLSDVNWI